MLVLGIETSCDETAVGIVDDNRRIWANQIATQIAVHQPYGGVVPEIAARAHLDKIEPVIRAALDEAHVSLNDIDGIAATCGPGLIGGVMVGAMAGKAMAAVRQKPFMAINHLEAHALVARLTEGAPFPYLLLLMSGGHCQLLWVEGVGAYEKLGATIDDAVGECFDKSAKILGLGYPGGPMIEKAAQSGNAMAFSLPHPMKGRAGCDFSFSGLKTAVRTEAAKSEKTPTFVADMAASLQKTITETLVDRTQHALRQLAETGRKPQALVVGGGVAANGAIRRGLIDLAAQHALPFMAPPPVLCTDNGVMIAWAGLERLRLGLTDGLDFRTRPRWPLEELRLRNKEGSAG